MKAGLLPMPRRALLIATFLLALALCAAGAAMVVAGVARFQAEAFLQDWQRKAAEPEGRAWRVAAAAALRAVAWYPVANGDYLDRLGQVQSWRFYQQPHGVAALLTSLPLTQASAIEASRRQALAAYRAAVAVRPGWPGSWARLAHTQLYLLQFDDEFAAAYAQAAQLGPWRIDVNRELAEMGFHAWPALTERQREIALEHGVRAGESGPSVAQAVQRLAAQAGVLARLCDRAKAQPVQWFDACR